MNAAVRLGRVMDDAQHEAGRVVLAVAGVGASAGVLADRTLTSRCCTLSLPRCTVATLGGGWAAGALPFPLVLDAAGALGEEGTAGIEAGPHNHAPHSQRRWYVRVLVVLPHGTRSVA